MSTILERTKIEALEYSACRTLPEEFDEQSGRFWIEAIGIVRKSDGSKNYCIIRNNHNNNFFVKKDFGLSSCIVDVEKIYPYLYLNKTYIPTFKDRNEIIDYLCSIYGEDNRTKLYNASKDDIKALVFKVAIDAQLSDIREFITTEDNTIGSQEAVDKLDEEYTTASISEKVVNEKVEKMVKKKRKTNKK